VDVVETRQPCILLVHDQHADDPRLLGLHSSWKFRLADRTCSQHLSEIGGACNHSYPWGETRACLNRHVRVLTTRWCSYHNADISRGFDSSETVTSESRPKRTHTAPGWSWVDVLIGFQTLYKHS
jgi:hypothetical protein